jgi:hypothetical protein
MTTPIDKLRRLAGKNAALMQRATNTQQNLYAAAEQESARLSNLIDGVSHADVLTDDTKAQAYQSWIMQRAGLQRLLAEAPQSSVSQSGSPRS